MRVSFFPILLLLALAGCNVTPITATPQEEAAARGYLARLAHGQMAEIERMADPAIRSDDLPQTLAKMAAQIPSGDPVSVTLVSNNHVTTPTSEMVNLTYEFGFPDRWLLENVAIKTQSGATSIVGLSVYRLNTSLEEQHRFGLAGKAPLQYLYLSLAVVMPLFCVFTLIICIRTRLKGRKWPWIVFILFGLGAFSINWATGATAFAPLMFQLLGAAATAVPYGPWIITFSLPVGALVFLLRRKALAAPGESASPQARSD